MTEKEGLLQRILERKKRYCRCQKGIICFPCTVFNKDLAELNKTIAKEIKPLIKRPDEGFVKRKEETWEECALRWFKNWDELGFNVLKALDSKRKEAKP